MELRGFEPLTFCMPCSTVSSDGVALGPVTAVQSRFGVWGRLARSSEIWGRWFLVWSWFAGPPGAPDFTDSVGWHPLLSVKASRDLRSVVQHRPSGRPDHLRPPQSRGCCSGQAASVPGSVKASRWSPKSAMISRRPTYRHTAQRHRRFLFGQRRFTG